MEAISQVAVFLQVVVFVAIPAGLSLPKSHPVRIRIFPSKTVFQVWEERLNLLTDMIKYEPSARVFVQLWGFLRRLWIFAGLRRMKSF